AAATSFERVHAVCCSPFDYGADPSVILRITESIILAILVSVFARTADAQQATIVGGVVVSSVSGQSLPYAAISVSNGIQRFTNGEGSFSVSLPPGQYRLRIRQL